MPTSFPAGFCPPYIINIVRVAMKEEYLAIGMAEGLASGLDQLVDVAKDLSRRG